MPIDRPTFHESWHRVANLRPRLRCTAQVVRQQYRGRAWYVAQDPANNQHFRLSREAYAFLGLLDGKKTVAQVWEITSSQLGDDAPTQGEVIQLLGQLHTANLLQADLPPDTQSLFTTYQRRVRREIGSYFINVLFPRIPLFNPERFLERWQPAVGWLFSWKGALVWLALLMVGFYNLTGRWGELLRQADPQTILQADNLLYLYLAFAAVKAIHELGHGFSCKHFGKLQHTGGNVHTLGIMLLVLVPCPYVDASSAWMLRDKWHRVMIGAAGMYVELAIAAVAAVVWAHTTDASVVHGLAYNVMFVASVSTILFNANPLLRYDGYYMLSDLLEVPNLSQRSNEYIYYLVKKYAFGVKRATHPATGRREKTWLVVYALTSGIYRIFISIAIIFYIADKLFFLGVVMAVASMVGWLVMPIGRFIQYLATSPELSRNRSRAVAVTAGFIAALLLLVGAIPMPDRARAQAVVEARDMRGVYMAADGFVKSCLDSESAVTPDGPPLLVADNPRLRQRLAELRAERRVARTRYQMAQGEEPALAQSLAQTLESLDQQIAQITDQLDHLTVRAPIRGEWVAWRIETLEGAFIKRGQYIGTVADMSRMIIRAETDQTLGPRITPEMGEGHDVSIRVKGRPDIHMTGLITRVHPAGDRALPSPAMAAQAGGDVLVRSDQNRRDIEAAQPMFEVEIEPLADAARDAGLRPGQRVVVRFSLPPRPLIVQMWRSLQQLLQARFSV